MKSLKLLLLVVFAVAVLAGCEKKAEDKKADEKKVDEKKTEEVVDEKAPATEEAAK